MIKKIFIFLAMTLPSLSFADGGVSNFPILQVQEYDGVPSTPTLTLTVPNGSLSNGADEYSLQLTFPASSSTVSASDYANFKSTAQQRIDNLDISTANLTTSISTNTKNILEGNATAYINVNNIFQVKTGSVAFLGGVSIGTAATNSGGKLEIQGGEWIQLSASTATRQWHINNLSGNGGFNIAESGVADGRLFIAKGGFIGAGTTNPRSKIEIAGGTLLIPNNTAIQGRNAANTGNIDLSFVGGDDSHAEAFGAAGIGFWRTGDSYKLFMDGVNYNLAVGGSNPTPTSRLDVINGSITVRGTNAGINIGGMDVVTKFGAFDNFKTTASAGINGYWLFVGTVTTIISSQTARLNDLDLSTRAITATAAFLASTQTFTGTNSFTHPISISEFDDTSDNQLSITQGHPSTKAGISLRNSNASGPFLIYQDAGGASVLDSQGNALSYYSAVGTGHSFYANGNVITPSVSIAASGNVGIGETAPTSLLDVSGGSISVRGANAGVNIRGVDVLTAISSTSTFSAKLNSTQTFTGQNSFAGLVSVSSALRVGPIDSAFGGRIDFIPAPGYSTMSIQSIQNVMQLYLSTANTTGKFWFFNDGGVAPIEMGLFNAKVGIGVAAAVSPSSSLDVSVGSISIRSTNAGVSIKDSSRASGFNLTQDSLGFASINNQAGPVQYFSGSSSGHSWYVDGDIANQKMLLNSSGNLLVGDATLSPSSKLQVNGGSITVTGTNAAISIAGMDVVKKFSAFDLFFGTAAGTKSTQTFSGQNTFSNAIFVSSSIQNISRSMDLISRSSHVFYTDSNQSTITARITRDGLYLNNSTAPIIRMWRTTHSETPTINDKIGEISMALRLETPLSGVASYQEAGTTFNNADLRFYTSADFNNIFLERMRIDRSGNVGIGVSAPTSKLHVVSNIYPQLRLAPIASTTSATSIPSIVDFYSSFDAFPTDQFPRRTASIKAAFSGGTWTNETLQFLVGRDGANDSALEPYERMRINGNGNVGVGTTAPATKFHLQSGRLKVQESDGAAQAAVIELSNGTQNNYVFTDAIGSLLMRVGSASNNIYLADDGGKVAVGGTAPAVKFQVSGGSVAIAESQAYLLKGSDQTHGVKYLLGAFGSGEFGVDGPALFGWAGGRLGTVSGGNVSQLSWTTTSVGVGTTNPGYKFEVNAGTMSVRNGPVYINFPGSQLIMKSPDGTCSACGPNNSDVWSCASVTCP